MVKIWLGSWNLKLTWLLMISISLAYNTPLTSISYTVGASIEVKLHHFREGTQSQKHYWIGEWHLHRVGTPSWVFLLFEDKLCPLVDRALRRWWQPLTSKFSPRFLPQRPRDHSRSRSGQQKVATEPGNLVKRSHWKVKPQSPNSVILFKSLLLL